METKELIFGLPPIFGLLPLAVYIVLSFKEKMNPVVSVFLCALLGAILVKYPLMQFGSLIAKSLTSFLVLIGVIIMSGSGLGAVLNKTGVAPNIVHILMTKIGVTSEKKAIIATMITSIILVTLLGTMAGANAIIAPIVIPLVATMGLTPSVLAVIFQGAGQTGLFIGPFSPPMVTFLKLTGLSYGDVLFYAGLPVAITMWIVTYFVALHVQKKTKGIYAFSAEDAAKQENYIPSKETIRATITFLVTILALLAYGIIFKQGASYAIFIMILVSVCTGLAAKLSIHEIAEAYISGMAKMMWMFMMFVMFDPFLSFVEQSGAFKALFELLAPLLQDGGKVIFSFAASVIGIFGINGAAVAQSVLINTMFADTVKALNLDMKTWAMVLLVGSQLTSFAYPGVDMLGEMGLARSKDLKSMLKLGYSIIVAILVVIVIGATII